MLMWMPAPTGCASVSSAGSTPDPPGPSAAEKATNGCVLYQPLPEAPSGDVGPTKMSELGGFVSSLLSSGGVASDTRPARSLTMAVYVCVPSSRLSVPVLQISDTAVVPSSVPG